MGLNSNGGFMFLLCRQKIVTFTALIVLTEEDEERAVTHVVSVCLDPIREAFIFIQP